MGIDHVYTLDAFDETAIRKTLQAVFARQGLSLLVVRGRCPFIESRKCQATEDRRLRTDDRGQMSEDRGQMSENSDQRTVVIEQRSENRRQREVG
jgi:hypothetical protein